MNLQPGKFGNPEFLSPLYQLALDQFYPSAPVLNLSDNLIARMKSPDRSMMVSLHIKGQCSRTDVLWLSRSAQHALGPGKGGGSDIIQA